MKAKHLLTCLLCLAFFRLQAASPVKTGWGIGPLPRLGYDADNGLYCGLQLSLNDYKDGGRYPNPYNSGYLDFSWYQKGIVNLVLSADNRTLVPGVRLCGAVQLCDDHDFQFFGLGGYQSNYSPTLFAFEDTPGGAPSGRFYSLHRRFVNAKADAVGDLSGPLRWEAGYHLVLIDIGSAAAAGEGCYGGENDLYTLYGKWGLVPQEHLHGGINSEIRAGLVYDTRDSEASPARGIWAEGHLIAAPKWLGTSAPYSKFCLSYRQYVPVWRDRLTFAFRLVYQGCFNRDAPWYILPYYTVVGPQFDRDGVGGFRTLRGIYLNRIQGLQTAFFNTELRWRFWEFPALGQHVSLCLSTFFEGGQVVRPYPLGYGSRQAPTATPAEAALYAKYISTDHPDRPHLSTGGGIRCIFNRNFIIAAEWGRSLNKTDARFPERYQDGGRRPSFYLNTGFTF